MEAMNITNTFRPMRASVAVVAFVVLLGLKADTCWAQFSGLIAFGDSLSDRGNTYQTLLGDESGSDQNVYDLIGYTAAPMRYDAGRWSNGPLWLEHLGAELGLAPLQRNNGTQPLTAGTDFAFGGATTGTNNPFDLFGIVDLPKQVENYLSIVGGSASPTSLYSVWAGGNDVIYYIEFGSSDTHQQHAEKIAANIKTAVTDLYNAGARHFLVPNLPPLGDKPDFVDTPHQAIANDIVAAFNTSLEQSMMDLRVQFPELKVATWDVYTDFNGVLQDPASFGFSNIKDPAYSSKDASGTALPYPGAVVANPNEHLFWDDTHPTAAGHALLGQYAFESLTILLVPEPSTLALIGVGAVVACGRRPRRVRGY